VRNGAPFAVQHLAGGGDQRLRGALLVAARTGRKRDVGIHDGESPRFLQAPSRPNRTRGVTWQSDITPRPKAIGSSLLTTGR
jgi:hypothetical protein